MYFSLASVLAVAGCQREPVGPELNGAPHSDFNVTLENLSQTKTQLSPDNKVLWSEGDQMIAFEAVTVGSKYKVTAEAVGKASGRFEFVETVSNDKVTEGPIDANVAFYPFKKSVICTQVSADEYLLEKVELPQQQAFARDSFASGAFPMVAVGETGDRDLDFLC